MSAQHTPGPAAEAIANANAHLNDAALKPYTQLAEEHAELLNALQIALPVLRHDYLALAAKYVGTPFERDPAYLRIKGDYERARAAITKVTGSAA